MLKQEHDFFYTKLEKYDSSFSLRKKVYSLQYIISSNISTIFEYTLVKICLNISTGDPLLQPFCKYKKW